MLGRGENVVVSTGTASGKSLIFRSLAFHKTLLNRRSRTLVLYPLKALAADQLLGGRPLCDGRREREGTPAECSRAAPGAPVHA